MKRLSLFAVLPMAAIMLFACNKVDNAEDFDVATALEQQIKSQTHGINVTQTEAQAIANMFMRSEAGNLGVATKSSDT